MCRRRHLDQRRRHQPNRMADCKDRGSRQRTRWSRLGSQVENSEEHMQETHHQTSGSSPVR